VALNRAKVIEVAQKHLAKGNFERAIAEYRKLVEDDPRDVRTLLKIGDIYTRQGSRPEAVRTYEQVAEHYASQGFFLKAVAVCKQILKLEPGRIEVSLKLGQMYEELQLVSDALTTYELVAQTFARAGNMDRALDTLGRMAALDAENIPVRIKYAEALSKAGRTEDAADEFAAGAALLEQQGRIEDYLKVSERLLYHRPADLDLARKLSSVYLERNDAKRALAKLQLAFKANSKDVRTLELLAQAFRLLGQTPKTISVYREIARIYGEGKRPEERALYLKRILELDPTDAEARQALAGYAPGPSAREVSQHMAIPPGAVVGSSARPVPEPEPEMLEDDVELLDDDDDVMILDEEGDGGDDDQVLMVDDEEEEEDILIVDEQPMIEVSIESEPAPPPASARPSIPDDVAHEANVSRLLTECDVFARYGLKDKVIAQLEEVARVAPDNVEGRERLKEAYLDVGRVGDAIVQLHALIDLFQEDKPQLAQIHLAELRELSPGDPRVQSFRSERPHADAMLPAANLALPETDFDDATIMHSIDLPFGAPMPPDATTMSRPEPLPMPAEEAAPPHDEDELLFIEGEDEQSPPTMMTHAPSLEELALGPPTAEVGLPEEPWQATPEEPESPFDDVPSSTLPQPLPEELLQVPLVAAPVIHEPTEYELAAAEAAAVERASLPPGEIEETLEEVEFFMAQALWQEARDILEDALNSHPGHPVLVDKLQQIEEAAQESARASVRPPAIDESFALAEKLAEELADDSEPMASGSEEVALEAMIDQFRKGVEQQIGLEDTDTHFDLGIAYKEMGLVDEAVHEFELSMQNPSRECISHTMIGMCYVEAGRIPDGISHFKKGLYAESKTPHEELGLYFELGLAYQALEDPQEALYYFHKVQKRDPDFRGVQKTIRRLTDPAVPEPVLAPATSDDELDRAFDDLLGDD